MSQQSIDERMVEIARVALETTRSGQTAWRPTDDSDAFLATFTQTSLIIDYFREQGFFKLSLLTAEGTNVESIAAVEPTNDPWSETRPDNTSTLLHDLHDAARRSALSIDELLDSAMADLRQRPSDEPPF